MGLLNRQNLLSMMKVICWQSLREHQQLGFITLNSNLAVSGWVGLAYDR